MARRREWDNTSEEGIIAQLAGRRSHEAHEYHASDDSDGDVDGDGDLVFNWLPAPGNSEADLASEKKSRKRKSGCELRKRRRQALGQTPAIDDPLLRALSEKIRGQQRQAVQLQLGSAGLQRTPASAHAQLAASLAATVQTGLRSSAEVFQPVSGPSPGVRASATAAAQQACAGPGTEQPALSGQVGDSGAAAAAAPPPGRKKRRLLQQLQLQKQELHHHQQQQYPGAVGEAGTLSPLHHELLHFAAAAAPTQADLDNVAQALQRIGDIARSIWPEARAVLFGSQATGLALPGADLDVVVLGASEELRRAGSGFSKRQRDALAGMLEELLDSLVGGGLLAGRARIIEAKVPIIKCHLNIGGGLAADISLGTANGARAVFYVCHQLKALPALRPLVLAVKAFLRQRGLNEVYSGGLSSYSIVNMLIGHLQREGHRAVHAAATAHATTAALPEERALAASLAAVLAQTSSGPAAHSGAAEPDLGALLWGFFDLYGRLFQYGSQAVSVRLGGIVAKTKPWRQPQRPWLLAVEDPQEAGKDIGSGSFNMRTTRAAFAAAAEVLAEGAGARGAPAEGGHSWADVQAAGQSQSVAAEGPGLTAAGPFPLLGRVIDVSAATGRDEASRRARAAQLSSQTPHAGTKRKAPEPGGGPGPGRVKVSGAQRRQSKRKLIDRAQTQQQRAGGQQRRGEVALSAAQQVFAMRDDAGRTPGQTAMGKQQRAPNDWRHKRARKAAQPNEARQQGSAGSGPRKWGAEGGKRKGNNKGGEGVQRKGKKKGGEGGKSPKPKKHGGWSVE